MTHHYPERSHIHTNRTNLLQKYSLTFFNLNPLDTTLSSPRTKINWRYVSYKQQKWTIRWRGLNPVPWLTLGNVMSQFSSLLPQYLMPFFIVIKKQSDKLTLNKKCRSVKPEHHVLSFFLLILLIIYLQHINSQQSHDTNIIMNSVTHSKPLVVKTFGM